MACMHHTHLGPLVCSCTQVRTDDITAIVVDLSGFYVPDGEDIQNTSPSAGDTEQEGPGPSKKPARRGSTTVEVGQNQAAVSEI